MHASECIRPSARTERSRSEERKKEGEIVVLRKKTITLILSPKNSKWKSPKKNKRFKSLTSESEMMEITKGFVLANTKKSTTWATRVFEEWVLERNVSAKEQCPVDLVQKPDPKLLNV